MSADLAYTYHYDWLIIDVQDRITVRASFECTLLPWELSLVLWEIARLNKMRLHDELSPLPVLGVKFFPLTTAD